MLIAPGDPSRWVLAVRTRPELCVTLLVLTDLAAVLFANIAAVWLRTRFPHDVDIAAYAALWPLGVAFVPMFAIQRLYSVVALNPADEIRRVVTACTLLYLGMAAATFLTKQPDWSRIIYAIAFVLTIVLVVFGRTMLRAMCAGRSWWGLPVVVLGAGQTGNHLVRTLKRMQTLGLKPVAVLDDDPAKHGTCQGVPVPGGCELAPMLAEGLGIRHAIIAMPGASNERMLELESINQRVFPTLIVIPNMWAFASLWVTARDLGGILGLEIRRNLLRPWSRFTKRFQDMALVLLCLPVLLPLFVLIASLVRLTSAGPAFYGHIRIGRNGQRFTAWKFRSMVRNGDEVLKKHLADNPAAREEWDRERKLRRDPRVTWIGSVLRATSLDELPQLINVLDGTMSLVGPRPIVDAETAKYGDFFELYLQVRPGITGLWQVSGRSETTYQERVALDTHYVRNWSLWLDVWILVKTFQVVILRTGAY